jgi:hypothetical protein
VTWGERVEAVKLHGFTERQAGFLVTVMLFSGVCIGRHYCTYAAIAYGQKMHDFFQLLVGRGFATARACGHNRARLYHLHHKPLYRAIGEPNSRYRRPTSLGRAVERLMVLDGVLADSQTSWMGTEREKLEHFTLQHRVERNDLPVLVFRSADAETPRYFPDKLPVGFNTATGAYVFLYVLTRDLPGDFRFFLERHAELLRSLGRWTIRLLVPRHKTPAVPRYQTAFLEQLASPLEPAVADDVRWYFRCRKARRTDDEERFDQAARAFRAPRYTTLYRAFVDRGERVLDAALSPVIADQVHWGTGGLECHVLPHPYAGLLSVVGTA